jgi:hypothetical protein
MISSTPSAVSGCPRRGPFNSYAARQPDNNHFRLWEVAGTAHADAHLIGSVAKYITCGGLADLACSYLSALAQQRQSGHSVRVTTQVAVERRTPRWPSRAWVILAIVAGAMLLEITLSLAWPREVPRFGFLPQPPQQTWTDGCSPHHLYYTRHGLFWGRNEVSLPIACPHI